MGIVGFLLRRPSVFKLRKKYDRLREKADRLPRIEKRIEMLRMLDQYETHIISLEEHHMSRFEKRRTMRLVDEGLRKMDFLIKEEKRKKR